MIFDILIYLTVFIALAAAGFIGFIFLRDHLSGTNVAGTFFGPKPEKRLDVVEQWSLDARRRLVLVRRDDVEHLIMTGGPVDVVIETGIQPPAQSSRQPSPEPTAEAAVFNRPPRTLGNVAPARVQAVGNRDAD